MIKRSDLKVGDKLRWNSRGFYPFHDSHEYALEIVIINETDLYVKILINSVKPESVGTVENSDKWIDFSCWEYFHERENRDKAKKALGV